MLSLCDRLMNQENSTSIMCISPTSKAIARVSGSERQVNNTSIPNNREFASSATSSSITCIDSIIIIIICTSEEILLKNLCSEFSLKISNFYTFPLFSPTHSLSYLSPPTTINGQIPTYNISISSISTVFLLSFLSDLLLPPHSTLSSPDLLPL